MPLLALSTKDIVFLHHLLEKHLRIPGSLNSLSVSAKRSYLEGLRDRLDPSSPQASSVPKANDPLWVIAHTIAVLERCGLGRRGDGLEDDADALVSLLRRSIAPYTVLVQCGHEQGGGSFYVRRTNGAVISTENTHSDYSDLVQVDLQEWVRHYQADNVPPVLDVLDLALEYPGRRIEPDALWRSQVQLRHDRLVEPRSDAPYPLPFSRAPITQPAISAGIYTP